MATATDYLRALQGLMPRGPAWSRDPDSALTALMQGLAQEFARIEARSLELVDEADPRTTTELLDDWERLFGLPDADAPTSTDAERRAAIVARFVGVGSPTEVRMLQLAMAVGYGGITISYYSPFVAGSPVGDPLTQDEWSFAWLVTAPSGANDDLLRDVLRHAAPLHTIPLFEFT